MRQEPSLPASNRSVVIVERIERQIQYIRGRKVMLDSHLAKLYGVPTKRLNEQVRRNLRRFPEDFMFRLTSKETASLRSQFATSKVGRGGRRYAPLAFTEQGVSMLSSVLNSERAIEVNILIMRVFVRARELMANYKNLAQRVEVAERTCDGRHHSILRVLRSLMRTSARPKRPIGFLAHYDK